MMAATQELTPGFIVIHGNQSETLRDLLRDWIRAYPLAPLENEQILVQSNGIAQWLSLSLATDPADDGEGGGLGISAAQELQLPSRFIWQAYRHVLGNDQVPERSPFAKELLTWRLMRLLPQVLDQAVYAPLQRFLLDDPKLRRRHQLAERLADLFDQYQVYRADWLDDWAGGRDVLRTQRQGVIAVPAESLWQPALWRLLLADIGPELAVDNRATIHRRFMAACAGTGLARPAGLPRRVLVFGISALPRQALDVLVALGRWCQILMCVQNPCRHFWADLLPDRELLAAARFRHARRPGRGDTMMRVPGLDHGHALLAAWGRQGRDLIGLLAEHDEHLQADSRLMQISRRADVFIDPVPGGAPATPECSEAIGQTQWSTEGEHSSSTGEHAHGDTQAGPIIPWHGRDGGDLDDPDGARAIGPGDDRVSPGDVTSLQTRESDAGRGTLLTQLQQDILDLAPLSETRWRWPALDPGRDHSIRFHLCHSPQREVEVLHDQLLAAFERDPDLQPRDVIVMMPDIHAYAPHIQAVFGLPRPGSPRFIPFTLADQERRSHEPLLAAVEFLLDLPQARVAVNDVLSLLDVPAVQRRFRVEAGQLPLLRRWIEQSGIRWGLNRRQRAALDLAHAVDQNSWLFGLRRMLLGYAVGTQGDWAGIEPMDGISGLDGELLGRLVALVDALTETWQLLGDSVSPDVWAGRLSAMLGRFFDAGDEHDALLLMRLQDSLQQWREDCEQTAMDLPLPLSVVREHWLAHIEEAGLSRRFFAGAVTFATLMPMRAIPFRVVCLLGMSDGEYPRSRVPADFDLMANDYRPGDRSRREDDRYLFLEALLSAREQLYVSWVGRSIHDDTPRPPSVLVAQLRDHLAAGWRLARAADALHAQPGMDLLDALTTVHRLQPFSSAYFVGEPSARRLFSYAEEWRQALIEAQRGRPGAGDGALGRWPPLPPLIREEALPLKELGRFLIKPVRQFFQSRLDVQLDEYDEALLDQEPFGLDGLLRWQLQAELIEVQQRAIEVGQPREAALMQRLARFEREGRLPVGAFGELTQAALAEPMTSLFEQYLQHRMQYPERLPDEPIDWPADRVNGLPAVQGLLDRLRIGPDGERLRLLISDRELLDGKRYRHDRLLGHWVEHLAGHLSGSPMHTWVVGKNGVVKLAALDPAQAREHWRVLLMAWVEGMCRPLPLATRSGFEWLFEVGLKQSEEDWLVSGELDDPSVPSPVALPPMDDPAFEKVLTAYQGGERQTGEVGRDVYLARAYPDFAGIWAGGEFARWVIRLLLPLREALGSSLGRERA
ncbi:MAG: exodeoxyribonuclease V subunit gamma [Lautropia sp.]|nr:exodeoxyribonuclease V subunit gamma [Lautropia sp.]